MRIGYSEDEDRPGQFALWQANCDRSLAGKKGQAALRELEAALLALPDKRLIADKLIDAEGEVCAMGALAKHKGHALTVATEEGEWDEVDLDGEMEDLGVELGMPRLVAWKVVCLNDIEIDGSYERIPGPTKDRFNSYGLRQYVPVTPEYRYEKVLAWVQSRIVTKEGSQP